MPYRRQGDAQFVSFLQMRWRGHGWHETADTVQNGNRGVVAPDRKPAIQHNVPVQECARSIDQGILFIVALHEHGVKGGDAAILKFPRPLDQARQHGEQDGV